jgi:hypothetical protein
MKTQNIHKTTNNEYLAGRLFNGFDDVQEAWVIHGRYVRCNHPTKMQCQCYGRLHEGEKTVSSNWVCLNCGTNHPYSTGCGQR